MVSEVYYLQAGINTPKEFIKVCQQKSYSQAYQTSITF